MQISAAISKERSEKVDQNVRSKLIVILISTIANDCQAIHAWTDSVNGKGRIVAPPGLYYVTNTSLRPWGLWVFLLSLGPFARSRIAS
jgi:hypothetical protein